MENVKFAEIATKRRYCDICQRRLQKEEAMICKPCYRMLSDLQAGRGR